MAAVDTAFTVKVDGRMFTLDRIKLGDWRLLKTEFGLNASDIVTSFKSTETGESVEILNIDNPNVLVGLLVCALHHERPLAPVAALIAEVDDLGMEGLEFPSPEAGDDEADPTQAGDDSEEVAAPAKGGKSAKP